MLGRLITFPCCCCFRSVKKEEVERMKSADNFSKQEMSMLCSRQYDPMEDESMIGLIHTHPKGVNSPHEMIGKQGICSSPRPSTITEMVAANSRNEKGPAGRLSVGTKANEVQKVETFDEAMSDVLKNMALPVDICLTECVLFCSMLSRDYRFTKDMLVWQWVALRLIELEDDDIMEQVLSRCFDKLLSMEYIKALPVGYDHEFDLTKYCVADKMIEFLQTQLPAEPNKFQKNTVDNTTTDDDVTKVEHLSLAFKEDDDINLANLKSYTRLQTLIVYCSRLSSQQLPEDLFLELKGLKILNLSRTAIQYLPMDIGGLKELRFLDVSETHLGWLHDSICCLSHLQTLKLDGCRKLSRLPERTSELLNLRHLVVSHFCLRDSRLRWMGNLTKLQTLCSFLVEDWNGYRIGELKYMDKLKGSLEIWNLDNVKTKEEASEARLSNKKDLTKIDLLWPPYAERINPDEEEILEHLRPPTGIQKLGISNYSGGVLPSWISCPASLGELVSLTLSECGFCDILPSLGALPSLKHLEIIHNSEVVEMGSLFCRKHPEGISQQQVAFPKLEELTLERMSKLERWTGVANGDFPCLDSLAVVSCPKLVGLPLLSHFRSLKHVDIYSCCDFSGFPPGGLPPFLEKLVIYDCPKLPDQF